MLFIIIDLSQRYNKASSTPISGFYFFVLLSGNDQKWHKKHTANAGFMADVFITYSYVQVRFFIWAADGGTKDTYAKIGLGGQQ